MQLFSAAGSVTKGCGSFYERFPEALEQGVKVKCTNYQCILTPPTGSFIMYPDNRIKCHQTQWKIGSAAIESDVKIRSLTFSQYK